MPLYGADFPPLGPPSRQQSVHLVDTGRSTPPVPPGFEAHAGTESKRSTSIVLPGLSKATAVPDLEGGSASRPPSRAGVKRTTSHITPVLPLRPATPAQQVNSTPASLKKDEVKNAEVETPTRAPKALGATREVVEPVAQKAGAQEPLAEVEASTSGASDVAHQADQSQLATKKEKPNAVAAAKVETRVPKEPVTLPTQKAVPMATQPLSKEQTASQAPDAKAAPITPTKAEAPKADQKRKAPAKLDIAAAVDKKEPAETSSSTPAERDAFVKDERKVTQSASAASKGESPGVGSPAVKSAPRTLRVVPAPNVETPPSATNTTPKETAPTKARFPSRQPSVASINLPGTPSSEQVSMSDNISLTSASQSRASSPPPQEASNKAESAPVRAKTKNQLKKERRERAAATEPANAEELEPTKPAPEEPAQEAILSRKKKAKKEKEPKTKTKASAAAATGESTPTASRPSSPVLKPVPEALSLANEQFDREARMSKPSTPTVATASQPHSLQSPHEPSPPPTPTITAAQLLAELKVTTPEIQKCIESLFRGPHHNVYKPNQSISQKDLTDPARWKPDFHLNLTKAEVDALLVGKPPAIHYGGEEGRIWDRGMITPSGAHLRALTKELEIRFLELEKAIREVPEELRFKPTKPQNETQFPSIDLEAVKRQYENKGGRGPSVMEQMVQDGSTMKKGAFLVDEASKYINEFVMPPATPPPSAGNGTARQAAAGAQGVAGDADIVSLDILERRLAEAKRLAEDREQALRKMTKKNKKVLGLS